MQFLNTFLKTLVIGMGILIVVGVIVLAVLVAKKMNTPSAETSALSITLPADFSPDTFSHTPNTIGFWSKTQKKILIFSRKSGKLVKEIKIESAPSGL